MCVCVCVCVILYVKCHTHAYPHIFIKKLVMCIHSFHSVHVLHWQQPLFAAWIRCIHIDKSSTDRAHMKLILYKHRSKVWTFLYWWSKWKSMCHHERAAIKYFIPSVNGFFICCLKITTNLLNIKIWSCENYISLLSIIICYQRVTWSFVYPSQNKNHYF